MERIVVNLYRGEYIDLVKLELTDKEDAIIMHFYFNKMNIVAQENRKNTNIWSSGLHSACNMMWHS